MARRVSRGDIWLYRFPSPNKRRPVLVMSRQDAIDILDTVLVAPITSTRHGIASEVNLGPEHGLKQPCAVNLDHVAQIKKRDLRRYLTTLSPSLMRSVCRALAVASGCT